MVKALDMAKNGKAFTLADDVERALRSTQPAKIQTYATVIGVNEQWAVIAVSENVSNLVGRDAKDIAGQLLSNVLGDETVHQLRSRSQVLSTESPVSHIQGLALNDNETLCDVTITLSGRNVFFEFEEAERAAGLATGFEQIQRLVHRIARKTSLDEAVYEAARTVQALSEFDRVSIHRIEKGGLDASLGIADRAPLHHPPSTKSLKAHAASFCAHLHLIPDVDNAETAVVLVPTEAGQGDVPDTRGLCSFGAGDDLRKALVNDNVRAAMTIPIRVKGVLWGLFVCHHHEPKMQSVGRRSAMALFSMLFGYEVERLHEKVGGTAREKARQLRSSLIDRLERLSDYPAAVLDAADELQEILAHDGMALWFHGQLHSNGKSLSQKEFEPVFSYLQTPELGQLVALDRLSDIATKARHLNTDHTAMLALPVSVTARDYVLLFRDSHLPNGANKSWLPWELEAAASLSSTLIESHSKLIEDMLDLGVSDRDQKGLLISELNHRVRNTLNLIRGMISQGREDAVSVEDYAQQLEARVYSLARAHDHLTELEWTWVGLHSLFGFELDDFRGKTDPGIDITGIDVDLSPTAYTTMALVLHELVTNAKKHGALSQFGGRVSLDVSIRKDGFAEIKWIEAGGPEVSKPVRYGFGMTIVEQSVPFELRGFADVKFEEEGLNARFLVPPGHLKRRATEELTAATTPEQDDEFDSDMSIDGAAMIVEDSLIIAIEAADLLRSAGATKVYSCNSTESAFRVLDESDVSFALLDVNLGDESSLAVAEQLWSDGIPAILATGYGSDQELLKQFPPMPLLTKPYDVSDLKQVLRNLGKEQSSK